MERLTERETRMVNSFDKDENYKADLYNRLAAYEDAEERGLLVRLPCKVGDTIHIIIDGHVFSSEVYHISYSDYYGKLTNTVLTKSGVGARFEDFGKVAFFTREEAEAALAKEGGA